MVKVTKKALALCILTPVLAANAFAEQAMEEVVVTGSYLKSSPTDGASPVEVMDRGNIDRMAALTIADITRNITANSGAENVPDSFTSGATQGTSNVNLRGLGLGSTLILVNGRRNTLAAATANDGSSFVDTSMIPAVAVQRVEVLKEGAASIYGSDAVAGVVNYIMRDDFEGLEIGTHYQSTTSDSQEDISISGLYGWAGERSNLVIAAQYLDRSALSTADRPDLTENAISGLGNSFLLFGPSTVATGPYAGTYSALENVPDANCVANDGILQPQPNNAGTRCGFAFGPRFNLVNEEERTHLYGSFTYDLENSWEFKTEAMWANIEVLDNPQSPSYPALSYLSVANAIGPTQAGNPFGVPLLWVGRPLGSAFPSPDAPRDNEHMRIAFELNGDIGEYGFSTALTHSAYEGFGIQPDTSTSRFSDAIAGIGGPNGDQSFNLFDPLANSQELINFISAEQRTSTDTELTVFDAVINGEVGVLGFASGIQIREESLDVNRNRESTVTFAPNGDLLQPADLLFLGGGVNVDESRSAWAIFSEFQWQATDDLEVRFAGRYEDLGDGVDTFDPKLSLRYQATDDLVLRASASSSFRDPSLAQKFASSVSLEGIQDFDVNGNTVGNPTFIRIAQNANENLDPEQANNYNLGAVWTPTDALRLVADYWRVDYTDVITLESAQGKVIANPLSADVKRTPGGTLTGVTSNYFNAAEVNTDGLDLEATYFFPVTDLGDFQLSVKATRMLSYEIPLNGRTTDVVGLFNHDNFARSLPETKANSALTWARDNSNASMTVRYIGSYKTTRGGVPAGYSSGIDSMTTVDLQVSHLFETSPLETQLTFGVLNATDEEPPQVWDSSNFSYDPRQHDGRGRMAYLSLKLGF